MNLNNTNQGDVYVHAAQSASQAGLSQFENDVSALQALLQKCTTTCPGLVPAIVSCTNTTTTSPTQCANAGNFLEKYAVTLSFPNCLYYDSTLHKTRPCASVAECEISGGIPPSGNGRGCTIQVNSTGCVVPALSSTTGDTSCEGNTSVTSSLSLNQPVASLLQFAAYTNYSADDPADALTYGTPNANGIYTESAAQYNAALKNCAIYMWAKHNRFTGTPSPNATGHYPTNPYGPNYGTWKDPSNPDNSVACLNTYEDYGSTFNGPVYSSDVIWDCGITFNGNAYTGNPIYSGPYNNTIRQWMSNQSFFGPGSSGGFTNNNYNIGSPYYSEYGAGGGTGCGGQSPTFTSKNTTNGIQRLKALISPPPQLTSLSNMAKLAGCLYTGPTVIRLLTGGRMAVYSPDTIADPSFYNENISGSGQSCGTPGTGCLAAGNSESPTCIVNVPEPGLTSKNGIYKGNGAVYVQDVPLSEQGSVSFCPNVEGEVVAPNTGTAGIGTNPPKEQQTCKWRGDLLIQGGNGNTGSGSKFDAYATFGSDSNIIVTGSLTYANPLNPSNSQYANISNTADDNQAKADSLGLAATYFTLVNLPGDYGYYGAAGSYSGNEPHANITIDGAILAATHAFGVDNLVSNACSNNGNCGPGSDGPLEGTITVNGSLDSNFTLNNCLVGTSGYCGFQTSWDTQYSNPVNYPPLFPQPVYTPYQYAEGS
ncbi:MAG: hypothetical protein HKL80_10820 [Acidimicrobiales bacterium]|nr:hypothetical protein [Acidimicrobiales bacterium]